MTLPWPSFWQNIPESERDALSDVLTELLSAGAIIGDTGRDRERFLTTHQYQQSISEYFAPLHLELVSDPDRPIYQLLPIPGECGLLARFSKAETLLIFTLWRIQHDVRMNTITPTVIVTVKDIWNHLKIYFENIAPPSASLMETMLNKLQTRRFIRIQRADDNATFEDTQVEILPTLSRAIPFENLAAWEAQSSIYQPESSDAPPPPASETSESGNNNGAETE